MKLIIALLALGWVTSGCGVGETIALLSAPNELVGATVTLEGKVVGQIDEYGMASFSVPSRRRNVVVVTKNGFVPIQVEINTQDGAGEIYPSVKDIQVHKMK